MEESTKYLFVTYSESDYESVDNIFLELYKRGIAIKAAKDTTPTDIVATISNASAILLVISPASMISPTIQYHLQLAEQFNKHIIPYFICKPEEAKIPTAFYLKLNGSATIPAYEYPTESELVGKALEELAPYFPEVFAPSKKRKPSPLITALSICLLCCAIMFSYILWIQPMTQEKNLAKVKDATVLIYSTDENTEAYSSGSGFFIDSNGMIATNYHVIEGATYILIQPSTEQEYFLASVLDYDIANDLALLQLQGQYTVSTYLTFSNKEVTVGDSIYVSGYPRGIDLTISNGIISNSSHYTQTETSEYFLVTAAVSPGNSGGPVVDPSGNVIGIATAKYDTAENVNLVRPVSYLQELINQ